LKKWKEKEEKAPEINMTPMIDCVFLLLIFFLVATSYAPVPGIRVKLPPPGQPPRGAEKPEYFVLRVSDPEGGSSMGTMVLNEEIATMEGLLASFQRGTLKQKEMLIIQSGRNVMHTQIVGVMDLAKRADIRKIGFAMVPRG